MSLDEIIKQNKARSAAGKPKQGAKPALQKGKGAPSQKKPAGKATAAGGSKLINKNLAATGGVKKAGASAKRSVRAACFGLRSACWMGPAVPSSGNAPVAAAPAPA